MTTNARTRNAEGRLSGSTRRYTLPGMRRRTFLGVGVSGLGLALHAGIAGRSAESAFWERQTRRPKALPDDAATLVPCLPFYVEIALHGRGPWSLTTELIRNDTTWQGTPQAIESGGRVELLTPAPPDGWVPGRYLVQLHLVGRDGAIESAIVGGYELLPMRFST